VSVEWEIAVKGSADPYVQTFPPEVLPTATPRFADTAPTRLSPLKSGRLNVVVPSPTPKYVPITAKRSAYVVLDTASPLQLSQPVGLDDGAPTHVITEPVGISVVVTPPRALHVEAPLTFNSSVKLL
jgi:hypothetical protein